MMLSRNYIVDKAAHPGKILICTGPVLTKVEVPYEWLNQYTCVIKPTCTEFPDPLQKQ